MATWRTEENTNNCQTPWESSRTRLGASPKQETDISIIPMHDAVATNGHHGSVLENGYGSPPVKQTGESWHRQCERQERPKNFKAPVDSFPKDNRARFETGARHMEAWKLKDKSPMGEKDCNKIGSSHSEVTKIVPLKPQRSKKSLNKENKDAVNPLTQSQPDRGAAGDVQMTKSAFECVRRPDDSAVFQSTTDAVKENAATGKCHGESTSLHQQQTQLHQHVKNEFHAQQELRDKTGQGHWVRGGYLHEEHFQNLSEFTPKAPTAPPRTLPLKTQWSRDRQSNMDNSHIHYKTPSQETAKRKQAVNHPPPACFVNHRKVEHCMSFRRCRANLVFTI